MELCQMRIEAACQLAAVHRRGGMEVFRLLPMVRQMTMRTHQTSPDRPTDRQSLTRAKFDTHVCVGQDRSAPEDEP